MRVSVTDLAAYRRFRNTDQTFEEWLARWKRQIPPTPAMRAGTRFHRFLETGGRDYADRVVFKLDFTPIKPDSCEVPLSREFAIGGESVKLVGRLDAIHGTTILDYKLLSRYPAVEKYSGSVQWRSYFVLYPQAERFRYQFFIRDYAADPALVVVRDVRECAFSRYPGVEDDVTALLADYRAFIREMEAIGKITPEDHAARKSRRRRRSKAKSG